MAEWPSTRRSASLTVPVVAVPAFPGPMGSAPVRRGAAAVAITGGALSLMGAAGTVTSPPAAEATSLSEATTLSEAPAISAASARTQLAGESLTWAAAPDVRLVPSVLPVTPDPDVFDDPSPLLKAVQMAEEQLARAEAERVAAEERAREEAARAEAEAKAAAAAAEKAARQAAAGADCGLDTGQLGAVKDYVREAAEFLGCLFGEPTMHGVAGRAGTSDHPSGKAIDFMVDRSTGDALAACALRNQDALGISYVIWEQRINHGSGWEPMEDRGGATANHMDHVHISFESDGDGELSC